MTHAAAATPVPYASRRRRPAPAAGERVGAAAGVLGAVALVVATAMLSATPSVDTTPAVVRLHLLDHSTVSMVSASTLAVGALLLVPFLASLRTFSARRSAGAAWRWTVTLVMGAVGISMLALAGAFLVTATVLADRSTDDTVFAVFVSAKLLATLALVPVAALVLANARAIAPSQRRPDRWLVRFDIEIAVLAAVASVATFVDRGWFAPGEPIVAVAWSLVALWVVALAATIVRGDHTRPKEGS
ncbi:MAG TPA: hypothetical protein VFZ83_11365 [Acidimicrobiia bacterium]|nr:hypothetical protein [Acidimicrobiia bacterium]